MPTVLVVDDEPSVCSLLQAVLEDADYGVKVARDGREALSQAASEHPDVVLSDILMPVLDGHELYAAMQADPRMRDIPIVLMSTARPIARAGEHPAAVIPKPFDIDDVVATLDRVVAK